MDWLIGQIGALLTAGLVAAVRAAQTALSSFWNLITRFFGAVADIYRWAQTVLANWQEMVRRFLVASGNYARWLLFTRIPQVMDGLWNRTFNFVNNLIQRTINEARSLFNSVVDWATRELHSLLSLLNDFKQWVFDRVAEFVRTINWLLDKVRQFLTEPSILATWLAQAMWHALFSYAVSKSTAIGAWVRQNAVGATLWTASLLETIIARVL